MQDCHPVRPTTDASFDPFHSRVFLLGLRQDSENLPGKVVENSTVVRNHLPRAVATLLLDAPTDRA